MFKQSSGRAEIVTSSPRVELIMTNIDRLELIMGGQFRELQSIGSSGITHPTTSTLTFKNRRELRVTNLGVQYRCKTDTACIFNAKMQRPSLTTSSTLCVKIVYEPHLPLSSANRNLKSSSNHANTNKFRRDVRGYRVLSQDGFRHLFMIGSLYIHRKKTSR